MTDEKLRLQKHPGYRIYSPVEQPPPPKFSTIATKWLYERPLLTINERAVVARFAEWLDETKP